MLRHRIAEKNIETRRTVPYNLIIRNLILEKYAE